MHEYADFCLHPENGRRAEPEAVPAFKEYPLESLKAATNGFSADYIVSESGEKAPNFVYKGRLDQSRMIAVKRFPKAAWPDAKGFTVMTLFSSFLRSISQLYTSHLQSWSRTAISHN